jgi:hypothetical protein
MSDVTVGGANTTRSKVCEDFGKCVRRAKPELIAQSLVLAALFPSCFSLLLSRFELHIEHQREHNGN